MAYEREIRAALEAVEKACRLCMDVQKSLDPIETVQKEDRSPVTVADIGSQAVVTMEILKEFPKDSIVGEEDVRPFRDSPAMTKNILNLVRKHVEHIDKAGLMEAIARGTRDTDSAGRFWTIDPVDGTKGFLRGDQYAVALALINKGKAEVGVLGCPNLPMEIEYPKAGVGCIAFAARGHGAFVRLLGKTDERRLSVDRVCDASKARFCESVEKSHVSHDTHARISSRLGITAPPLRIDSQCKYVTVARGDASIYLRMPKQSDYREKIWDHAAGALIVEEAGGLVTNFRGELLDFSAGRKMAGGTGILATNGKIHRSVLDAIAGLSDRS